MAMTRKDYVAIAEVLSGYAGMPGASGVAVRAITYDLAAAMSVNPNFDRARFIRATGVDTLRRDA